jgi:polysaccharide biosynthesis/export protein
MRYMVVLLAAFSLTGCSGFSPVGSSTNKPMGPFGEPLANGSSAPRQDTARGNGPTPGAAQTAAVVTSRTDGEYKMGPADVLNISVFNVPELTKTVQVADTGTINLPLVGEVPAAGKTAQQLERDLTTKLGAKYLQNPQVTVTISENNSQHVTVQGAVEKPGVYPIMGKTTLLEFVALAGGFKDTSDSTVLVLRTSEGKRSTAKYDVADIQKGQAQDPTLQSDDVVVAGTSAIKQTFNTVLKALPLASTAKSGATR